MEVGGSLDGGVPHVASARQCPTCLLVYDLVSTVSNEF